MKQGIMPVLCVTLLALLLSGCACNQRAMPPYDGKPLNAAGMNRKADTFHLLFDASSSMAGAHGQWTKFQIARGIAQRLNTTLPALGYHGGLRVFGPTINGQPNSSLLYGIAPHDRTSYGAAIDAIPGTDGWTPIAKAFSSAAGDLKNAPGSIAVLLISDGEENGPNSAVAAARTLKKDFGERLCIYTIHVGASAAGSALLQQVADEGGCGSNVAGDTLLTADGMNAFVQQVFVRKGAVDSDGDGVLDHQDRCPGTLPAIPVDAQGCAIDDDHDGVYDYQDQCLGTPRGTRVDYSGCPPKQQAAQDRDRDGVIDSRDRCPNTPLAAKVDRDGCWELGHILFDNDKSYIRGSEYDTLQQAYDVLMANPDLKLRIDGHTSNTAAADYNMALARKRAQTVRDYFVNMGLAPERFSCKWYGLTRPVAPNDTERGRALNRRVELHPQR